MFFPKDIGLKEPYNRVFKLCKLVLTIPITSASVKRSFSPSKRINISISNSRDVEIISNLAVLSINEKRLYVSYNTVDYRSDFVTPNQTE